MKIIISFFINWLIASAVLAPFVFLTYLFQYDQVRASIVFSIGWFVTFVVMFRQKISF